MIDNYLLWSKRWRKFSINQRRAELASMRKYHSEYLRGFSKGYICGMRCLADRMRTLQKDIEARKCAGYMIIAINPFNGRKYQLCEQTGGKNGKQKTR